MLLMADYIGVCASFLITSFVTFTAYRMILTLDVPTFSHPRHNKRCPSAIAFLHYNQGCTVNIITEDTWHENWSSRNMLLFIAVPICTLILGLMSQKAGTASPLSPYLYPSSQLHLSPLHSSPLIYYTTPARHSQIPNINTLHPTFTAKTEHQTIR